MYNTFHHLHTLAGSSTHLLMWLQLLLPDHLGCSGCPGSSLGPLHLAVCLLALTLCDNVTLLQATSDCL
jgi:hypothetical protein